MKIQISGIDAVQRQMEAMAERTNKSVASAIMVSAQLVRTTAIKSIQEQSSGREVTRSRNGGARNGGETYKHIAAGAGETPNTDTGRLVGSIHVDGQGLELVVGTPLEYGANLEHGTARMSARPWLFPALEKNRSKINSMIHAATKRV